MTTIALNANIKSLVEKMEALDEVFGPESISDFTEFATANTDNADTIKALNLIIDAYADEDFRYQIGTPDTFLNFEGYSGYTFVGVVVHCAEVALRNMDEDLTFGVLSDNDGTVDGFSLSKSLNGRYRLDLPMSQRDVLNDRSATGLEAAVDIINVIRTEAAALLTEW